MRVPFRLTAYPAVGTKTEGKKKMNKRYLPAIATVFILAIASVSFMPVFAATTLRAKALPQLVIVTIPEDDEIRKTGIIVLDNTATNFASTTRTTRYSDLMAQYKILVSYNGVPVAPTTIACQIIEKDKVNPIKDKQAAIPENLKTSLVDQTGNFMCKFRWGKPGVGVLDLYFKGAAKAQFLADYVVLVYASYKIGRSTVYGAEIQDVCVLGWDLGTVSATIDKDPGTGTDNHYVYADPLGSYVSCEDATMYQKHVVLGLPVPWS